MKILIAYDGFNPVSALTENLKQAGLPQKVEAVVFTALNPLWTLAAANSLESPVGIYDYGEEEMRISREAAEHAAMEVRKVFSGWEVKSDVVLNDSPSKEILKKAEEWEADLILIGSHRSSRLEKFFLGSVAQNVLVHARCPIRLMRFGMKKAGEPLRIILGMETSTYSLKAADLVAARDWPKGTTVKMITAFDFSMSLKLFHSRPAPSVEKMAMQDDPEREWIRARHKSALRALTEKGLSVLELIEADSPAHLLLKEAREWPADCIFMGARGLGAVDRFLIGSTSLEIAMKAPCSVEIVR